MSNRLGDEKSPYLLQHKDNPVDWYPWSDEAFDRARREDKPIFLSIGYSTCHWCHVMAHESFEDEEVAQLMNETFVSIKVDREERPDIDGVYMTACQMMTGHGGWPLTLIMTPDKRPFHAATYVPKSSRFGRMGMLDLVPRIQDVWENRRPEVLDTASEITQALEKASSAKLKREAPDETVLRKGYEALKDRFDPTYGGFGSAPKFPSPHNLFFLLRYWHRTGETQALDMVTTTLEHMRLGGVFDHLGYGFHRYSTDRKWLLPHFEKMLYDQALLAMTYTETYQATGRKVFRATAEEIFEYVVRDMRSPEGAFYSAEDADSEGREGKFYVWTVDEIHETLPDELADLVIQVYNLVPEGNFEEESTRERTGENILHLREPVGDDSDDLARARKLLFEAREERVRPGRDDKVLLDWNGLMIAALSKAAAAFDAPEYAKAAARAAGFVVDRMQVDGRLQHRFRGGEAAVPALLDDYAFLIWGLIELYEATFETTYLREALRLQEEQIELFWDESEGGFFFTARDAESLIVRQKEFYDGALPSGNAVSLLNLLRLARMTGRADFEERGNAVATSAGDGLSKMPAGFTAMLTGLDFAFGPTSEIVVAGRHDSSQALLNVVRESFRPRKVVLLHSEDSNLADLAPFVADQKPFDGTAAAYVCRNFQCERPVSNPDDLRRSLNER